jgi:hypothetical protein
VPRPDGIEFEVPQPTQVIVRGIDKQLVGQTAAEIRKVRPPEPYKGKGIRYEGEFVAGRSASAHERTDSRPREARRCAGIAACAARSAARRAAAPGRVPLEPRHLRAADRRRRRPHARGASWLEPAEVVQGRKTEQAPRSASGSPRAPRRPASRPSSSTAAATSTTVASRRSPTARARED